MFNSLYIGITHFLKIDFSLIMLSVVKSNSVYKIEQRLIKKNVNNHLLHSSGF